MYSSEFASSTSLIWKFARRDIKMRRVGQLQGHAEVEVQPFGGGVFGLVIGLFVSLRLFFRPVSFDDWTRECKSILVERETRFCPLGIAFIKGMHVALQDPCVDDVPLVSV